MEHFVTLFDHRYLPLGMAMHESLIMQMPQAKLWVVCMSDEAADALDQLNLPQLNAIRLAEIENEELLRVKPERSVAEYCWTMTPFTIEKVFNCDPSVQRVTYLDADLFFFSSPLPLLEELTTTGKLVQITEHGYAPEYDMSSTSGRFCVQFQTFSRDAPSIQLLKWWQTKCIEDCSDRPKDGLFGDQKYVEAFIERCPEIVNISSQTHKMAAPWNAAHLEKQLCNQFAPVFYHFHGLRMISNRTVILFENYRVLPRGLRLYYQYIDALAKQFRRLHDADIPINIRDTRGFARKLWSIKCRLLGRAKYARLKY